MPNFYIPKSWNWDAAKCTVLQYNCSCEQYGQNIANGWWVRKETLENFWHNEWLHIMESERLIVNLFCPVHHDQVGHFPFMIFTKVELVSTWIISVLIFEILLWRVDFLQKNGKNDGSTVPSLYGHYNTWDSFWLIQIHSVISNYWYVTPFV